MVFYVPKRNKLEVWKKEKEEKEKKKKVSLLTHATARGMGKNLSLGSHTGGNSQTPPLPVQTMSEVLCFF